MDTDWMSEGSARTSSPTIFFPSDGVGVQVAQRICAECPVAEACLEYALEDRVDHGVWGGTSERERRRILRRRRVGLQPSSVCTARDPARSRLGGGPPATGRRVRRQRQRGA